jgi:P2-related tail formation protein
MVTPSRPTADISAIEIHLWQSDWVEMEKRNLIEMGVQFPVD